MPDINISSLDKLTEAKKVIDSVLASTDGIVKGEDLVDLSTTLARIAHEYNLMQRDIITGLFKTPLDINSEAGKTSEKTAQQLWLTFFKDRIKLVVKTNDGTRFKKPTSQELDLLWNNVAMLSTYNSRKEMFESIPAWDGVPRIKTFLKEYFNCDTNPNMFLLLMTSIVGKMDNPEKAYCPYWFEFVGLEKGTGKSSVLKIIFGDKYVIEGHVRSRMDDFFVNAYNANALVYLDDEMHWTDMTKQLHFTPDEFKSIVTEKYDIFSRKFGQPETHARSWVIVRTANNLNNVFSSNERRQVIFNVRLKENECRVFDMPEEYKEQLKAEAKAYYLKYGVYQLSDKERDEMMEANVQNFSSETTSNYSVLSFVEAIRSMNAIDRSKYLLPIDKKAYNIDPSTEWIGWRSYEIWRKDNHEKQVDVRVFNRVLAWIARAYPHYLSYNTAQMKLEHTSNAVMAARLKFGKPEDIVDMPDVED